jgi:16S rRNA (guanine1207-N2)-methyltransferase
MAHYFTNENLPSDEKEFKCKIKDVSFTFITDNGVFSKNGLDFGTRTLLESLPTNGLSGDVLDFGCGYGPIGIFISKIKNIKVDMLDINLRSIELSKKNSEINKADTNVFYSNIYENVTKKYDFIISNPPIRVGNEILYKILFDAKKHLKNNGELWIVINKNQGAKTIMKKLEEIYDVELVAKNKGFYIIKSKVIDKFT